MEFSAQHYAATWVGVWGRRDTCIRMAESLCCTPKTTTALLIDSAAAKSLQVNQLYPDTKWKVKRKGTSVSWAWPTNIYTAVVLSFRVTLHTSLNKSNCFDSDMTLRTFILFLKLANCFSFKQYSSVGTYWTTFKCLMTQSSFSHSYIHPSKYSECTIYNVPKFSTYTFL